MTQPKSITTRNASATQTEYPTKASIRTFVQSLIPSAALFLLVVPQFVDIVLEEFGNAGVTLPGWAYAVLTGLAVACGLIAAIVSRVMAIPGVEKWLREHLGVLSAAPSHPERLVEDTPATEATGTTVMGRNDAVE